MDIRQLQNKLNQRTPSPMDAAARYAVLVPLVDRDGELHLLYEVRATALRRQPNEVCFPGGRIENEETAQECALRETREELAIPPEHIHMIGPLDFICHRAGFVVYPVLALIDTPAADALSPNPNEVEDTFLVPLSALRTMRAQEYHYQLIPRIPEDFPYDLIGISTNYPWQPGTECGPVYPWNGRAIWGMTGRITRHVLSLLDEKRT